MYYIKYSFSHSKWRRRSRRRRKRSRRRRRRRKRLPIESSSWHRYKIYKISFFIFFKYRKVYWKYKIIFWSSRVIGPAGYFNNETRSNNNRRKEKKIIIKKTPTYCPVPRVGRRRGWDTYIRYLLIDNLLILYSANWKSHCNYCDRRTECITIVRGINQIYT